MHTRKINIALRARTGWARAWARWLLAKGDEHPFSPRLPASAIKTDQHPFRHAGPRAENPVPRIKRGLFMKPPDIKFVLRSRTRGLRALARWLHLKLDEHGLFRAPRRVAVG